jgi:uncharacterized LabA/DUF88 family protein
MQRTAIFVDAGYVFAQGSVLLTGTEHRRELLSLDIPQVAAALSAVATDQSRQPLLRIYWYDAMVGGRPTREQLALADFPDIKIRLGQVNSAGEQKGVDALIVTDMIELARNHAMSDAVLVSGDEDVRVGVVLAQQFGVRVHLLGINPARPSQSRSLQQEADTTVVWDAPIVQKFLTYAPPVTPPPAEVAAAGAALEMVVEPLVTALSPPDLAMLKALFATSAQVPAEHDRALLRVGRTHYGQATLTTSERAAVRGIFVRLVIAR